MIELLDDPAEFDARAGALLESTVRNTVLATVLVAIRAERVYGPPPRFALVSDGSGTVIGAALRTSMALHVLAPAELREPPRPAPGHLRPPVEAERDLLATWGVAFVTDADLPQRRGERHRLWPAAPGSHAAS